MTELHDQVGRLSGSMIGFKGRAAVAEASLEQERLAALARQAHYQRVIAGRGLGGGGWGAEWHPDSLQVMEMGGGAEG